MLQGDEGKMHRAPSWKKTFRQSDATHPESDVIGAEQPCDLSARSHVVAAPNSPRPTRMADGPNN